jgi:hypothetical protein
MKQGTDKFKTWKDEEKRKVLSREEIFECVCGAHGICRVELVQIQIALTTLS